jgi:hypothetical protein
MTTKYFFGGAGSLAPWLIGLKVPGWRGASGAPLDRGVTFCQRQRTSCPLPSDWSARADGGDEDKGPRLGCTSFRHGI